MKSIKFSLFDFGRPLLTSIKTQTTPNRSPTTLSWQNSPLVRLFSAHFPGQRGLYLLLKCRLGIMGWRFLVRKSRSWRDSTFYSKLSYPIICVREGNFTLDFRCMNLNMLPPL